MICLDTNFLILGLVAGSRESDRLRRWIAEEVPLVAPAIVWYEFLCGPVQPRQVATMRAFLQEIIVFSEAHAHVAAELFNNGGRRRSTRIDAMIAATAIVADVPLATNNTPDFESFQSAGLRLA